MRADGRCTRRGGGGGAHIYAARFSTSLRSDLSHFYSLSFVSRFAIFVCFIRTHEFLFRPRSKINDTQVERPKAGVFRVEKKLRRPPKCRGEEIARLHYVTTAFAVSRERGDTGRRCRRRAASCATRIPVAVSPDKPRGGISIAPMRAHGRIITAPKSSRDSSPSIGERRLNMSAASSAPGVALAKCRGLNSNDFISDIRDDDRAVSKRI